MVLYLKGEGQYAVLNSNKCSIPYPTLLTVSDHFEQGKVEFYFAGELTGNLLSGR